jgi:hypothetical protein
MTDAAQSARMRILTPEKAASTYPRANADTGRIAEDVLPASYDGLRAEIGALASDPANGVTGFWVPASPRWAVVTGAATFGTVASRLPGWTLPKADCRLAFAIDVPSHCTKMRIDVVWVNPTGNAGTASLGVGKHEWTIGDTVNATPFGHSSPGVANTSALIATYTAVPPDGTTSTFTVNPAKWQTIRVERIGTSASDTLPSPIAVLGLNLRSA